MEIAIQMFIDKETADDDFITSIAETTKQLLHNVRKEGYEPTMSTFSLDCKPDYDKGQIAIKAKIGTEVLDVNKFMTGGAFIDMIKEMDNESINE